MNACRNALMLAVPIAALVAAAPARAQQPAPTPAQQPAAAPAQQAAAAAVPGSPAPAVGDAAPDFTAPGADEKGTAAQPVSLHDLKGKVVVVAFYPKDRSSGCTAELTKFRDEQDKIFGKGTVVLPISLDDVASHESWAKDAHFPFTLVSDQGGKIATQYGSITPGKSWANRTVFVIGRDGKIAYQDLRFGALDQHAYDQLAAAVRAAQAAQ